MKKLLILSICLVATAVLAQTNNPTGNPLPPDLWNTNVKDWQLNGVTLWLIITSIGRAFSALKSGGGLTGIIRGLLYGTNTPAAPEPPKP